MNWQRMPPVLREIRIAILVPEIRARVLKTIGWRLLSWALMPTLLIYAIPLFVIMIVLLIEIIIKRPMEWLCRVLPCPYWMAVKRRSESLRIGHEMMSPEEIRKRVYPDRSATIIPGSLKLSGDALLQDDDVADGTQDDAGEKRP